MLRAIALALAIGCSTPPATPATTTTLHPRGEPLAAAALIGHVRALVDPRLDGREAATAGERAAIDYVTTQLRALGLTPIEQDVAYRTGSHNLYTRIDGARANEVVVVGAHLDHLGRHGAELYPGADDNASGVAVVLGVTAALVARRGELQRSVIVVWFGAEEPGMIGSRQFVANPPVPLASVAVMINVDMIGRPLLDQPLYRMAMPLIGIDAEHSVGLVGTRQFPGLRAIADAAFAVGHEEVVAAEDLPDDLEDEVERQSRGRGDSVSFEARGVPAMFFGDGESTDYHQTTDTLDKVSPELLERRARSLVRVVVEVSRAPASAFARSDEVPAKRKPPPRAP